MIKTGENKHDQFAPYWAIALVMLCGIGISTSWIDLGDFWKGYVLDITGPAWNYILFRRLFTNKTDNAWTRFFSPVRTLIIFLVICFGIETAQYFKLYDATFDPWDLVAYVSLLIPIFLLDFVLVQKTKLAD
jgi:hypothetical protein